MYIYLGGNIAVNSKSIVGVFDLDNTTVSKKTRDFLNVAEKQQRVIYTSYDLPKTFVICNDKKRKNVVYITAVSAQTIRKRCNDNSYVGF